MLFKRHNTGHGLPIQDKAAKGIAKFLLYFQTMFTNVMSQITGNMCSGSLKIVLILFCLLGGGFSIYQIGAAILKPDSNQPKIQVDRVNMPKYFETLGNEGWNPVAYVDQETFLRIVEYERFTDSLGKTSAGLKMRDSIRSNRPGLQDSILMLKNIYQTQLK